jgi:O-antigen/teichoic acid export membrane protein
MRVGLAVSSFLAAMFVSLRHPLTLIIYGPQWIEAENALAFSAAGLFLGTLGYLLGPALDALGFPRLTMFHMALIGAVAWVAAPLGLIWYGLDGFAAGTCLAFSAGGLLTVGFARWLLPELPVVRVLVANAVATAISLALGHYVLAPLVQGPLHLVVAVILLGASFLSSMFVVDRTTFRVLLATVRPGA